MKEQKHIDRIFQEKLRNFEAEPQPHIWEGIQTELHNKKKNRKIIPFWWRLGGVAAALMLMLGIGYTIFNANQSVKNSVVNQNDAILDSTEKHPSTTKSSDDQLAFEDLNSEVDTTSQGIIQQNSDKATTIASSNATEDITTSKTDNNFLNKRLSGDRHSQKTNADAVTKSFDTQQTNKTTSSEKEKASSIINNEAIKDKNNAVVSENGENRNNEKKNGLVTNANAEEKAFKVADNSEINTEKKIEDDILKETLPTEKTIEEAVAEAENIIDEEEKEVFNRWRVSPNVAPVYFNSLGEGSTIHSQFNENNKSTNVNLSYGIAASYSINKKLKVRAGINSVGFDYRTNGVLTSDVSSRSSINSVGDINTIKFNQNASATNYMSSRVMQLSDAPEVVKTADLSGLEQRFGFIEVPLELEYNLVDKKVGLNVIGGLSTFFLNNNDIYAVQNGNSTLIGEANNLNDISYSANFGLGAYYNFSKSLQFNFEPMFKYQINTFSNTFGDFQPFFVGVYTGLSYKF